MSKIENAFQNGPAFIGFLTAGDPNLSKTEDYVLAMADAGADLIEIGIPFSDPVAEGKVIEAANERALKAGTTLPKVFDLVERIRRKTQVPLVFLSYLNPIFCFGFDAFFQRCAQVGVDGIIIPDLPYEERGELLPFAQRYQVDIISMIAPTSESRIKRLAQDASGFIYLVSSMGVTGVRQEITTDLASMIQTIQSVTDVPVCVGFGISTPEQAKTMVRSGANGVIVGSAIVKIIEAYGEQAEPQLREYVTRMKTSIQA